MDRRQKIAELFAAVLEKESAAQTLFLERECGGDTSMQAEIRELVKILEEADSNDFLGANALELEAEYFAREESDARLGETLGHYKILEKIGAGGMGAIYLAERADEIRQRAAIKIIKRGMDTDAILRRFRNERQILANLEHPNIAHFLDAGTTADGLPFFVMELVEGLPVDEYCRAKNLSETARLDLFRKICAAVSFAHQKLIVHRDLKPSNILVNEAGEPKLLDFGIAKLLDSTDESTQTNMQALTPAYASPEQLRGEIVGTTTDVFSLGKVLAEILESPKSKIQSLKAENQKSKTKDRKPKTDLQNILAMALREDAARRYQSVEQFGEDVRRYLAGLPVAARKDSFSYRASKFVRRNRIAAAATILFVLSLIGGMTATLWEFRQARQERARAEQRAENLRKLSGSFAVELHNAILNLPGSLAARQMLLTRAVEQLDALAAEAENKPELQDDLAQGYYNLGLLPNENLAQVEQNFQKGAAIYHKLLEGEPQNARFQQQLAKGYGQLANVEKVRGNLAGALDYLQESLAILQAETENAPAVSERLILLRETQSDISSILLMMGRAQEALEMSRQSLNLGEKLKELNAEIDDFEKMQFGLHYNACKSLIYLGDYAAARAQLVDDLKIVSGQADKHPNDMRYRYEIWAYFRVLSSAFEYLGDSKESLQSLQSALGIIENLRRMSPDDAGYQRNLSSTHLSLGQFFARRNQPEKALSQFHQALELSEKIFAADPDKGETIEDLARIYGNLGQAQMTLNDRRASVENLRKSLAFYEKSMARDAQNAGLQSDFAATLAWLGEALTKNGDTEDLNEAREFEARSAKIRQDLKARNLLKAADADPPAPIKSQETTNPNN